MVVENAVLVAAWAVVLVVALALGPRLLGRAPAEPAPREPTFYDLGGPILDLEAVPRLDPA